MLTSGEICVKLALPKEIKMKIKDFDLREIKNEELFELFYDDLFKFFENKAISIYPFIRFDAVELNKNRSYDMGFVNDDAGNKIRKRSLSVTTKYLHETFHYDNYSIEISPFACEVFEDKVGIYGKNRVKIRGLSEALSNKLRLFMQSKNNSEEYKQWCDFYLKGQEKEEQFEV